MNLTKLPALSPPRVLGPWQTSMWPALQGLQDLTEAGTSQEGRDRGSEQQGTVPRVERGGP